MFNRERSILLFDIDNTLVDRDRAFQAYIKDFIHRNPQGFEGQDETQVMARILDLDQGGRLERSIFCRALLSSFPRLTLSPEDLWQDHQELPEFVTPAPETAFLLEDLSQDFTLAIASNGSGNLQRRKLLKAGLMGFFTHIFISGEMGSQKPEVSFFESLHKTCGLKPLVMIGDDYRNDIIPAKGYGLKTIWIDPLGEDPQGFADTIIPTVHHVKEALRCIL